MGSVPGWAVCPPPLFLFVRLTTDGQCVWIWVAAAANRLSPSRLAFLGSMVGPLRTRELKHLEHKATCSIKDDERGSFCAVVSFLVDLVPLSLACVSANYARIWIRQPVEEDRLRRMVCSAVRVLQQHFLGLRVETASKTRSHTCY